MAAAEKKIRVPREVPIEDQINAIFRNDLNSGKQAMVLMANIVTDLAATRNSDPLRRFMTKARGHAHNNYKVVMGLLIRCYFGDKMVTATPDEKHPTGTNVTLKFSGNPAPRNLWGFVTKHVDNGGHYNDRAFLKNLREHLNPDEEKQLMIGEMEVGARKRMKNLVKWIEENANLLPPSWLVTQLETVLKDEGYKGPALPTTTKSADVINMDEVV